MDKWFNNKYILKNNFSSSFQKYFSRIILKASLLANGQPDKGSLYLAGAPVTEHTKLTGPLDIAEPATTATFECNVYTNGQSWIIFVCKFLG